MLLGAALIIYPDISALMLCGIFGGVILLLSVVRIIFYFRSSHFGVAGGADLAAGLLGSVAGIVLLLHPGEVTGMVQVLIGIIIFVDSVLKFQAALEAGREAFPGWWAVALLSLVGTMLGLLIIINPFGGARLLMMMTGITLAADGAENIFALIYIERHYGSAGKKEERGTFENKTPDEESENGGASEK